MDLRRTWPLVGRDGIVDDLLSDLTRGRLRVASLHGPSGIGKSRLMDELAARWSAGGRELLRLRGTEVAAQLPLGVLGPLLAVSGPEFDALRTDPVGVIRQARDAALALAPSGRLLVLVDDAQLVDPLSAAVLAGLLDLEVVLLVAAVREGEPASETVSSLWRSDRGRRVDLTPLDERGVLAALTAVLGGDVSHRTALEFQHASGGNPLLLRELALGALDAGTLRRIERVWQWDGVAVSTPGLRDLVLARLERLPPDARSALERVALCSALPIDEVPSELLGGLEALEEEGLVAIGDQGGALVASAAHPQYAAAALEAVPRMRAVRVLIEQSDAARAAARTPQDEVRAATYRLEAGAPDNPALLASAAATARRLDDHVAAIRLATAAIDAGDDSTATLAVLGDSLRETGRSAEALEVLERALALERVAHPGSAEHASLVAAVAQATAHAGDRMVDAMDMLSRFASEHPEHRHVVGPVEVWLCFLWGAVDRALAVVDATTAGVTPVADRNAIEVMAALPLAAAGRADEATQLAARAVRDARSPLAGSPFTRRFAALVESWVALLSGDLATAERAGRESLTLSIERTDEVTALMAEFVLAHLALEQGRLPSARRWFADVASGARLRGPEWLRKPAEDGVMLVDVMSGDRTTGLSPMGPRWRGVTARAWLESPTGERPAAAELAAVAEAMIADGDVEHGTRLLHVLVRVGAGASVVDRLEAVAAGARSPLLELRRDHGTAAVAADPDALAAVAARWEQRGFLLYAAEAFAQASHAASRQQDGRSATAHRREAERIRASLPELSPTPALAFSGELAQLTVREREVAMLAASGLPSKEIAERLFLSTRTVENHLRAAYQKLGVHGRAELQTRLGASAVTR